jgi:Icc-related predicted phosphoesterase
MKKEKSIVKIAAVADIHVKETDTGKWTAYFREVSEKADVIVICGDLTDTGDESEAKVLAEELKSCTIPVIMVLGNHDYEKGREKLIRQTLLSKHVHILDGEAIVIKEVGFAGIKGFGGGFDKHMLSMFGEKAMKDFVQESVNEALQLERALARLESDHQDIKKIALLHYSPIADTVVGESEAIFPFLGSSRLAEPLSRRKVVAAFHGHAHIGTFNGKTHDGIPVFNVAKPLLLKEGYTCPFYIHELEL